MAHRVNKTYTVKEYYDALDKIAAFSSAESWDNTGILLGSPGTKVKSALVALDVTSEVIAEAELLHANLIITHHPVIFPQIKRIDGNSLLYRLICGNINVISAHTNYDAAENGVNDALATVLGLENTRVLESAELPGLGRLGELHEAMSSDELAAFVKQCLGINHAKYTMGINIAIAAVCGGAGAALWRDAQAQGAHALITSEVKHNQFIEAAHASFTLIDAGHYATEIVAMAPLAKQLSKLLDGAAITLSKAQKDPACYV